MEEEAAETKEVAFDIETDGVEEHIVNTIGIAWTWSYDVGIYLPLLEYDVERDELIEVFNERTRKKLVQKLCDFLKDYKLIMHNGMFDIACIYHRYGIDLTDALHADTMLMKHTIDEERPFGLKDIGELMFGEEAKDEQSDLAESVKARGGKWNKTNKDIYKGELKLIQKYAIKDVVLTLKVYDEYSNELERQGLEKFYYNQEVMPLYKAATIPMKLDGMFIDVEYFKELKKEVEDGIIKLTDEVFDLIEDDIEPKVREILDKNVNMSRTGKFAEGVLRYYYLPVPTNKKTGKPTLAKSALRSLEADEPEQQEALDWLLWDGKGEEPSLPEEVVYTIKKELYVERYPKYPRVFNLSSTHHLSWLLFDVYDQTPTKYSKKTKKPTVDKDALEHYDLPFIPKLAKLKKEEKVLSTYINPILERQHNGWLYPSMQQWGTTSGRYSCGGGLNFQTLPRDDKRIKRGFIAPPGHKVVAADFSSLEPRIFAWVSNDAGLKEAYWDGLDLYSKIAIEVLGLDEYSADPNDDNFLKDVAPDLRDLAKVFTLAVPYGAGAGRIAGIMKKEYMEAQRIIDDYLDTYPELREYMLIQEDEACNTGMVWTRFGRVRHLPRAKELYDEYGEALFNKNKLAKIMYMEERLPPEEADAKTNEIYYEFRNYMNNAKNFPIQSTAAHVTNAALIYLRELLDDNDIDGWICLQVHDEIICIVNEDQAELAADLLRKAMEENWVAKEIDIPMIAQPEIADSFAEAK